jgi:hypothetical protein
VSRKNSSREKILWGDDSGLYLDMAEITQVRALVKERQTAFLKHMSNSTRTLYFDI